MKRVSFARKVGAAAASLAVSLVAAELLVERFLPVGNVVYAVDEELLFDARPGVRRIQAMPPAALGPGDEARVLVETNSLGFRGPELDRARRRPRLLVLGDSFVMAENVPLERTFVRRLEVELASLVPAGGGEGALPGVECVNGGRSSYGPDQVLLLAERRIDEVAPDALLIVLCAYNDLGDLARNRLFRIGPGGRLERQQPRLAPAVIAEFARREREASRAALVRLWHFSRQRSRYRDWPPRADFDVVEATCQVLEEQAEAHFVRGELVVDSLFEDLFDAAPALAPEGELARREVELLTAILRELAALARARGIPCGALITPVAPDLVPEFLVRVSPERYPDYRPGTLPALHASAANAAGLPVIDVTPAFAAHAAPGSLFVGGDDPHWNAAGQSLAAEVAAPAIGAWPHIRTGR